MITQYLNTQAAFALRITQFGERLYEQMGQAMAERDLQIATKTMGIVQLLFSEGAKSQAQISQRLNYSHQLTAQRLRWLYKHDYAVAEPDPSDGRKSLIQLTETGVSEGEKLQSFLPLLIEAYRNLFDQIDIDIDAVIQRADDALRQAPLAKRLPNSK